ncbi:PilN domain-containing protein [Acidisphaera sp. S103]|uniref:PilN domain-containing protein n=1 Tax=Acidisphaera sp. S103 TaxID=1747223 RepID=UPI00131E0C5A|nr:PilN domain-containing protein [Acidisphaera sp. S103]
MLAEFATWWVRQIRDLVPPHWRGGGGGPRSALVIDCGSGETPLTATCWRRVRRRETPLGAFLLTGDAPLPNAGRRMVVLRAAIAPLECEVTLPLAAEPALQRILTAEMDRLTPFAEPDVFWTASVEGREPAQGRLRAILSLIPRSRLQSLLGALDRLGVAPTVLESVSPDGTTRHIPLRPPNSRGHLASIQAGCAAALILAAAMAAPFLSQLREAAALQREAAELRPRVDRAQALRRRLAIRPVDAADFLAEKRRVGDAMQVLATLTDLLPDDTFITTLGLRQRKLTVSGQSAAAAGLIAIVSSGPRFRDPAFAAPVVRDPASQIDTFSLNADVAP